MSSSARSVRGIGTSNCSRLQRSGRDADGAVYNPIGSPALVCLRCIEES